MSTAISAADPPVRLLAADVAAGLQRHDAESVQHDPLVHGLAAVHGEAHAHVRDAGAAADVAAAAARGGREAREREVLPRTWQVLDEIVIEDDLLLGSGRVDQRRLAGDGDRFRHRADAQRRVSRRHAGARDLDVVALDGAEAGERKRHRVAAGPQVLDPVVARAVRHHGARLLDEYRARGFNSDPGQHAAGCIFYLPGDGSLREGRDREKEQTHDNDDARQRNTHAGLRQNCNAPGIRRSYVCAS